MHPFARICAMTIIYCAVVASLDFLYIFIIRRYATRIQRASASQHHRTKRNYPKRLKWAVPENVKPLDRFEHERQVPNKYRPFVFKGHVMMGMTR